MPGAPGLDFETWETTIREKQPQVLRLAALAQDDKFVVVQTLYAEPPQ